MSYNFNLGLAFYAMAKSFGDKTALSYPDGTKHSFAELNRLSNRIARFLLSRGAKQNDIIAIFNDKSVHAYAIMLASLKIGTTYTNLDNTNPGERLRKIIGNCNPTMIFFDSESVAIKDQLEDVISLTFVNYSEKIFENDLNELDNSDIEITSQIHGGVAAYLMFTSGSTGFPKGAVMSHNNVLNFIQWGQQTFSIVPEDVFTNVNPIYFDNSVFDFYTSLFSGATLVPLNATIVKNTKALVEAINNTRCTIWFSVPSLIVYLLTTKALTDKDFSNVRRIAFGGEGFPKNKLKQLFELLGSRVTLFNVYGPTECTCICSSYIISERDFENMSELAPLGYIAPNFGYEIVPVADDNPDFGQLALTGPCVGMGYYNDPERTAKSFVQNPKRLYQERMYLTGDVVERGSNGHLYFRGRADNQIKHMGYRIELEEVEAGFSSLSYINEVGVIYERLTPELGQIKAFVSLADKKDPKEVLADIKSILPVYMIPKIIVMDSLPKNRNGKIDRKQLEHIK